MQYLFRWFNIRTGGGNMICERIKELRTRVNLTQAELAKTLNITRSSVNAWEMGISVPSTQYIVELADLFKVSTDYLLNVSNHDMINITKLSEEEKKIIHSLLQYFNQDIK